MKPITIPPRTIRQRSERIKKKGSRQPRGGRPATAARHSTTAAPVSKPGDPIPQIELFQREGCPQSHAVRTALDELGVDFIARSVSKKHPLLHERLVEAGGKDQTPFLYDRKTGMRLYELGPILAYLEKVYGKAPKSLGQTHPEQNARFPFARRIEERVSANSDRIAWALRAPAMIANQWVKDTRQSARSILRAAGTLRQALTGPVPPPPPAEEREGDEAA